MPLLDTIKSAFAGMTPDTAATRLAEAEARLEQAHSAYEVAAHQSASTGDDTAVEAAEAEVVAADQAVSRAKATLNRSRTSEAERIDQERIARERQQDDALRSALGDRAAQAAKLSKAAASFCEGYEALCALDAHVRELAAANPRARHDLLSTPMSQRVGQELGRLVGNGVAPPAANTRLRHYGNLAAVPSLVDDLASQAAAMTAGLHHV